MQLNGCELSKTKMDNQAESTPSEKNRFIKPIVGFLLAMVFFIGIVLFWINRERKISYTIPGVPYYNVWNHRGEAAYFSGETAAAIFSVLDYWSPGITKPAETDKFFKIERKAGGSVDIEDIKRYVDSIAKDQYIVQPVVLKQNEIKQYVNSEIKTPLLVYLPISEEQPADLAYYPVGVVIGVNEIEGKITVHDFWLGNNREISFDELGNFWERKQPNQRNMYFVIQPKNLKEALEKIKKKEIRPYPIRTTLMVGNEVMIKNYVLGIGAQTALNYDLASSFFSKIESDPAFQSNFIPVLKVQVLSRLSAIKLQNKDLAGALSYAEKAVELDHDIDKPLDNGWLGYEYVRVDKANQGKSPDPYRVLGNVYKAMGENEKAIDAYKKVLEIDPTLQVVIQALKELQG